MSAKNNEVLGSLAKTQSTATTAERLEERTFKEQVERGLRDVAAGRTITHEELKERMARRRK